MSAKSWANLPSKKTEADLAAEDLLDELLKLLPKDNPAVVRRKKLKKAKAGGDQP